MVDSRFGHVFPPCDIEFAVFYSLFVAEFLLFLIRRLTIDGCPTLFRKWQSRVTPLFFPYDIRQVERSGRFSPVL
ncbi:hypothetical protein B4113_0308 [Geobacillus sp. B4113_201601]|nr:hypothetical protein B4113_0308 [Geobacillus sp. B4113_201601]